MNKVNGLLKVWMVLTVLLAVPVACCNAGEWQMNVILDYDDSSEDNEESADFTHSGYGMAYDVDGSGSLYAGTTAVTDYFDKGEATAYCYANAYAEATFQFVWVGGGTPTTIEIDYQVDGCALDMELIVDDEPLYLGGKVECYAGGTCGVTTDSLLNAVAFDGDVETNQEDETCSKDIWDEFDDEDNYDIWGPILLGYWPGASAAEEAESNTTYYDSVQTSTSGYSFTFRVSSFSYASIEQLTTSNGHGESSSINQACLEYTVTFEEVE